MLFVIICDAALINSICVISGFHNLLLGLHANFYRARLIIHIFFQEPRRKEPEVKKEIEHVESQVEVKQNKIRFEFYDPGNHWCRNCNLISGNIYEVFQHLQSKKHQQVTLIQLKN